MSQDKLFTRIFNVAILCMIAASVSLTVYALVLNNKINVLSKENQDLKDSINTYRQYKPDSILLRKFIQIR